MKQHSLSAVFPALPDEELEALAADIKAHGLRQPIVMFEGMVLDGWHRYRACKLAGVAAREIQYQGTDPVAFVKSLNWHRRHLSASQRAAAIVAMTEWKGPGAANGKNLPVAKSTAEMAAAAAVSTQTIKDAKRVLADGAAPVVEAVKQGDIAVHKAAEIAKLPKREQRKALKDATAERAEPAPKPEREPTVSLAQYKALEEKYDELVDELKTYTAISEGETAQEMNLLRASLKQANRARDDAMRESAEKSKTIARLEKELKKLGWDRHSSARAAA